jgi:hypothetical protein
VGLFGVFGVHSAGDKTVYSGYVIDRIIFHNSKLFPFEVQSVDECLFGFRKHEYPGTDPNLGFHLYGTDLCCAYRERGKKAVVIDAICFHNSQSVQSHTLKHSEKYFASTLWKKYLPITTPVSKLTVDGHQESFTEGVERLADARQFSELHQFLQDKQIETKVLRTLVSKLLKDKQLEAAFVLAANIHPTLREQHGIATALCLGGAKMGIDTEMNAGLQILRRLLAEMTLEEQKNFYKKEIMPFLLPMLNEAVSAFDKVLTGKLLHLMSSCFMEMPEAQANG